MPVSKGWTQTVCAGLLLASASWSTACIAPPAAVAEELTPPAVSRLAADAQYLASDELAGRDVGSPGIALAGEFIAQRFQQLGLVTELFDGSPYQEFTIPGPATLGAEAHNRLQFDSSQAASPLQLGTQFTPLALGSSGSFSGEVVFVGYGITAPELNYDDYANLDVRGKVVIALRKEPGQDDPESRFEGDRPSQHAFFSSKELNAAVHGAAALLLINDQVTVAKAGRDEIPGLTDAGRPVSSQQIPTLYCLRAAVEPLLQQALGKSLQELEDAIERAQAPHSYALPGIGAQGETLIVQSQTAVRNVYGLLPGQGNLADQYIVIGAHYDHVGMGGAGSLAPGTIAIHNGADDNGSGTAVLLEAAHLLSSRLRPSRSASGTVGGTSGTVGGTSGTVGGRSDTVGGADAAWPVEARRSIIFVAFTAEERGLLGSKHYIRNPRWPLEQTVAMLNMDMVGRMQGNSLTVYGTGTAEEFSELIDRAAQPLGLSINQQAAGFGPSDHASFYEVGIPVLHFFTGLHNDYHRPGDDFEKLNVPGMASISALVTDIAAQLATLADRPTHLQSSAVAQIGGAVKPKPAVLGVTLDAGRRIPTVVHVISGSAAATAGVHTGDIIAAIDDQETGSVDELQELLRSRNVGQAVRLSIRRAGQRLQLKATLQTP